MIFLPNLNRKDKILQFLRKTRISSEILSFYARFDYKC